jgi:hypothetical protein
VAAEAFRAGFCFRSGNPAAGFRVLSLRKTRRRTMDLGKGVLLWLIGVPLPIILLLALFWHH